MEASKDTAREFLDRPDVRHLLKNGLARAMDERIRPAASEAPTDLLSDPPEVYDGDR